ncbi:hypothetical protein MGU_06832 [Metarhizium guizhouense ARSEF 977]|uniref:Uncharacterized protein n=1 Tax=Metarhizium guizhouense (strain ARSEF 977) TaxID=1276136 RepID=A0A0B4GGI4_METGA|nr:hypothetical protein MGU_06832 [Metarhizium guizhouense ARSEF 977]
MFNEVLQKSKEDSEAKAADVALKFDVVLQKSKEAGEACPPHTFDSDHCVTEAMRPCWDRAQDDLKNCDAPGKTNRTQCQEESKPQVEACFTLQNTLKDNKTQVSATLLNEVLQKSKEDMKACLPLEAYRESCVENVVKSCYREVDPYVKKCKESGQTESDCEKKFELPKNACTALGDIPRNKAKEAGDAAFNDVLQKSKEAMKACPSLQKSQQLQCEKDTMNLCFSKVDGDIGKCKDLGLNEKHCAKKFEPQAMACTALFDMLGNDTSAAFNNVLKKSKEAMKACASLQKGQQ